MTEQHPLTDDIIREKFITAFDSDDLRAAADWQLDQVIEWLRENLNTVEYEGYLRYLGKHSHLRAIINQELVISDLTKAIRPQQQGDN